MAAAVTYVVHTGDVLDVGPTLEPGSVDLVVTSPPYAEQRKDQYGGVPEAEYPSWTVAWMDALLTALADEASVVVNIRPHMKDGEIADYTLRMRLAVREAGWHECEELIWYKPDTPPFGNKRRPRRMWESLHWFARVPEPYIDVKALGHHSGRADTWADNVNGQGPQVRDPNALTAGYKTRSPDVFVIQVGGGDVHERKRWPHPAPYPKKVPAYVMAMLCPPGGTVCDPFSGSGTTGVAALESGRTYIGIERDEGFADMSRKRLEETVMPGRLAL
jgi:site-specific DNA-methyltransferase (adenine-specific)